MPSSYLKCAEDFTATAAGHLVDAGRHLRVDRNYLKGRGCGGPGLGSR
jgi:hypothetical protein